MGAFGVCVWEVQVSQSVSRRDKLSLFLSFFLSFSLSRMASMLMTRIIIVVRVCVINYLPALPCAGERLSRTQKSPLRARFSPRSPVLTHTLFVCVCVCVWEREREQMVQKNTHIPCVLFFFFFLSFFKPELEEHVLGILNLNTCLDHISRRNYACCSSTSQCACREQPHYADAALCVVIFFWSVKQQH